MEERRFAVPERAEQYLLRAAAEERALPAEDLAFHEADIRPAEDQEHPAGPLPAAIPQLL